MLVSARDETNDLYAPQDGDSMNRFRSYMSSLPVAGLHFGSSLILLALGVFALLLSGCGAGEAGVNPLSRNLNGIVHGGQQPVTGAALQMYAVGTTGDASVATPLLSAPVTTSDGSNNTANSNANAGNQLNQLPAGSFTITGDYTCPSPNAQVYLVATGGNPGLGGNKTNPALAMLAVLGRCGDLTAGTNIVINELTTIGSLAPLVPYMTGLSTLGSGTSDASQLATALDLVRSYTDISNGGVPGPGLAAGFYASSQEIVTLADILAACINSDGTGVCQQLFTLTTPPSRGVGIAPTDTVTAALNILKYPTLNTVALFSLIGPNPPFGPALTAAPANWALPIVPVGPVAPKAATPVISPATGVYALAPLVTITDATSGAVIYYTLNGSTPTTASSVYSAPITLPSSTSTYQTVQAIASVPNLAASAIASATFLIPAANTTQNLVFVQQPVTTQIGGTLPNFRTGFVDSYGNTVRNGYAGIYLSLQNNPANATLGGSTGVSANSSGFADFNSITVDKLGTGYTLLATWYGNGTGPITAVSAPFDITQAGITLSTPSPLLGTGTTQPGTFTLQKPAPVGGVTVNFSSSNAGAISISPASVSLNAGDTTGAFTYTAVGSGTATLRASATGYLDGTVSETTSANYVSLATLPTFTLGQTQPLTLTLSTPAPSGGLTVSLASSNPAVASITPATVVFAAGATTSTTAPSVSAKTYGTAQLTATAPGYAPDAKNLVLSGVATVTATLTTTPGSSVTDTITLGQAAPTGGVSFTISSDKTSVAYPYPTSVTVPAGATSATFSIYAAAVGNTTIRVNSPGFAEATTAVSVNGTMSLGASYLTQPAAKLYVPNTVTLNYRPTAATSVTITSSNPAVLLLSTDPNVTGFASITMSTATTTTPVFYEQGQAGGTVNLTITATNYTTLVQPVTVNLPTVQLVPLIQNKTLSLTEASGEIDVALGEFRSDGVFIGNCAFNSPLGCKLNPGVSLTIDVTSSNSAIGTLTSSPVTLTPGTQLAVTRFQPVGAGTANVTLGTFPAGFIRSTAYAYQEFSSFAITITQPTFILPNTGAVTGTGVTIPLSVTTSVPDATIAGATVTVTSGGGALISTDPNVMGSASVVLNGVKSALPTLYLQGLVNGQSTLTFSAPGYKTLQTPLGIGQASVIIGPGQRLGVSTTTVSTPAQIELDLIVAGFGNCFQQGISYCFLNPATSNQFNITSSNSAVGTVGTLTMAAGQGYATGGFTGLSGGNITLTIAPPPTPLVPSSSYFGTFSISASVSQAVFNALSPVTGVNLSSPVQFVTNTAPLTPQNVTLTSSNAAIAVLSTNPATFGSATAIAKTNAGVFYVQGLSAGTTTLTMASTGYTTSSTTITVLPSGVVFGASSPYSFSTTAFSPATPLALYLAAFNATTGVVVQTCAPGYCTLNPGAGLTATVISSNLNTGTITTSAVTFAGGSSAPGSTGFLPNDLGQTTLSIIQPAGFTNSTLGASAGVATVIGNPISGPVYGGIITGAGTYTGLQLSVDTTGTVPVTITVSLADPSLGKLSLDPNTMGTGSTLTFPSITKLIYQSSSPAGAIPPIYVQGIAPGYTQLIMSGKGYLPSASTVLIGKVGLTLAAPSNITNYLVSPISSISTASAAFGLSVLDPYSQSVVGDCGQYVAAIANNLSCTPNPGTALPALTLIPNDASIGTFPSTPTPLDTTNLFTRVPFTGVKAGLTNYGLGTPSAGFYNTSTINHRQGYAGVYGPQAQGSAFVMIAATDIDGGVGIEVPVNYALSGTIPGYYNSPFTITVGDPTIAVVSFYKSIAGTGSITFTGFSTPGDGVYLQGLKAGTTTVTFTLANYQSRTINVTIRPSGFTIKKRDIAGKALYQSIFIAAPALLNDAGQWMADAIMNPQSASVQVALVTGNAAVATVSEQYTGASYLTFGPSASSASILFNPVAAGSTSLSLGAVSAPFIQATTYQTINATVQ